MDCKHFDTSDIRSGIAATDADLNVVGMIANEIRSQGNRDLAVSLYRKAMEIRDMDMVINTVLLLACRSLEISARRHMPQNVLGDLDDDKLAAMGALQDQVAEIAGAMSEAMGSAWTRRPQ